MPPHHHQPSSLSPLSILSILIVLGYLTLTTLGQQITPPVVLNCTIRSGPLDFSAAPNLNASDIATLTNFHQNVFSRCNHIVPDPNNPTQKPTHDHPLEVCYVGKSTTTDFEYFRVETKATGDIAELKAVCDLAAALYNSQNRSTETKKFLLQPLTQDPLDEIDSTLLEGTPPGNRLWTNLFNDLAYTAKTYEYNINTDLPVHQKWSWGKNKPNPLDNPNEKIVLYKPTDPENEPKSEIHPPWELLDSTSTRIKYSVLCEKYDEQTAT